MSNSEIKTECEELYLKIKESEARLQQIRELECSHEDTHKGLYSFRVGNIQNAIICNYCNKCIKTLNTEVKLTSNLTID